MKKFFGFKISALLLAILMLCLVPLQCFAAAICTPKTMGAFYDAETGVFGLRGLYNGIIQPNRMYMVNLVDAKGAMISIKNPMGSELDKGKGVFEYGFDLDYDALGKYTMPMKVTLQCTTANVIEPISAVVGGLTLGDVNLDKVVNNLDATVVLQYDAGIVDLDVTKGAGDVNDDSKVNNLDATEILKYDAGIINSL